MAMASTPIRLSCNAAHPPGIADADHIHKNHDRVTNPPIDGESAMRGAMDDLQQLIDTHASSATNDPVRLLEAGCGSRSRLRFGENVRVTGIDISAAQLARNTGLSERILGDIQTYQFPKNSFDMIICWDVLEHLKAPESALQNFFHAIRPGGLIILHYPNLYSLKGLVAKASPHIVHVWYYRYLLHQPNAALNDTAPFITHLHSASTYPAIRKLANSNRAREVFFALHESLSMQYVRKNFRLFNLGMKAVSLISRTLSFGTLDLIESDCIQVFEAGPTTPVTSG
jgi:SAM-dependent methyltransferase